MTDNVTIDGVEYVTVKDAAALMGYTSLVSVYRLCRNGTIAHRSVAGMTLVPLAVAREHTNPGRGSGARGFTFPPDVAKARRTEQIRRSATAQGRAKTALLHRHKVEYDELYAKFVAEVNAERGPLPGDDVLRPSEVAS